MSDSAGARARGQAVTLKESIREGMRGAMRELLMPEDPREVSDEWRDDERHWRGQHVIRECRRALADFETWLDRGRL